jgi:carboxyl-terminal processing protease
VRRALPAAIGLALASVAFAWGSPLHAAQAPDAAATFDKVWTIVHDTHFMASFDEAAWDRARDEYRPRALSAKNPGELRGVLREMLATLGLSHFAIIPATPDAPGDDADVSGQPGFDVRLIGRQLVVWKVDSDGGAAAAGVHPGWIITSIGGTPVASLLSGIQQGTSDNLAQLEAWRLATTKLRGPSGTNAQVSFEDGAGDSVVKAIARKAERGQPVTVGSLPTMFVRVSSTLLDTPQGHKAGEIRFNVWMTAVDRQFQDAMDRFHAADGIVIDLRGNPGGLAAMIMGIAGYFTPTRDTLGVMKTRDSELRFVANPRLVNAAGERVAPYGGPVAIIVDGLTGSASECFAGGMQSLGRARVFGQQSMGQALPALFDRLPNGDVFIHAWGDFVTGTGVRIEGRGVVPDEPTPLTRADLLAGHDAPIAAALAWIDRAPAGRGRNP